MVRLRSISLSCSLVLLTAIACSGEGPMEDIETDTQLQLPTPTLEAVSPVEISIGDTVTVFGQDLPGRQDADVFLQLEGNYVSATGDEYAYTGEHLLSVDNPSVASFNFDKLYFDPSQADIGTFRGEARLLLLPKRSFGSSTERDADTDADIVSNSIKQTLEVGPSLVLDRLHSIEASGCADVTAATNQNHELALEFRAIGLGEASEANPWTFRVQVESPQIHLRYIKSEAVQFDGSLIGNALLNPEVSILAPEGDHRLSVRKTSGDSLSINPGGREVTLAKISPRVEIGLQEFDEVVIGKFAAGPIERDFGHYDATLVLEVIANDGRTLTRVVNFGVYDEAEIGGRSTKGERMLEIFEPEIVPDCACVPGGHNGRELQYSEGESVSFTRSLNFRWDQSTSTNLGFQVGKFTPVAQITGSETWNESFGVDINEAATSEIHQNRTYSAQIIPSWYGTCYRQVSEVEKTVDVIGHNACGASGVVGQAVLTDYHFNFDIATGPDCPAAQTELPEPQSFR